MEKIQYWHWVKDKTLKTHILVVLGNIKQKPTFEELERVVYFLLNIT